MNIVRGVARVGARVWASPPPTPYGEKLYHTLKKQGKLRKNEKIREKLENSEDKKKKLERTTKK